MKRWAFYKEGGEWYRIGIRAALSKERLEPGVWRKRSYFSTHYPPSVRLKMHIRRSPRGKYLFAYNPGQDAEIESLGGGESLAHYLYKIAISELSQTTLKLSNLNKDVKVQFIESEIEKRVYIEDRYYDLDVFVKFISSSEYQLKWGGELGIEVHKTNPVIGRKLADLKALRIPVIEIDVNKKLAYKTPEEDSTAESERVYVEYLKGRLSEYLWSVVLSDPKSLEYLEKENTELIKLVNRLKDELYDSQSSYKQTVSDLKEYKSQVKKNTALLVQKESRLNFLKNELVKFKKMRTLRFLWYKLTDK